MLHWAHMSCAATSISLFLIRGGFKIVTGAIPNHVMFKVAPHVVDTLLLVSAIALTLKIGQYPFLNSWLTVKFFALVAYIILGSVALKRTERRGTTTMAVAVATLLFGFIVSVAWYHHPLGVAVWVITTS